MECVFVCGVKENEGVRAEGGELGAPGGAAVGSSPRAPNVLDPPLSAGIHLRLRVFSACYCVDTNVLSSVTIPHTMTFEVGYISVYLALTTKQTMLSHPINPARNKRRFPRSVTQFSSHVDVKNVGLPFVFV